MSDLSTISIMFEELKQMLKQKNNHTQEKSISTSDFVNIENRVSQSEELITQKLEQMEQAQKAPKKLHHRISVDIKSSWVSFLLVGLALFSITLLCLCYKLNQVNNELTDNDVKYRYIKMHSRTDSIQISQLEEVFVYNRNEKIIKQIKSDIQDYERSVLERAKLLEQARLRQEEAQKLQNEADKLKK